MIKAFCLAFAGAVLAVSPALAQAEFKPAMTLGKGSGPVKIEADSLEVQDKNKSAVFSGNVIVRRDDVTLRAGEMTVFYSGKGGAAKPAADTGPTPAGQDVTRITMKNHVFFTQKDQQATGDSAVYERASETLTLVGNVVLTQGQNVARGKQMIVNMKTGKARLEGRPNMILVPGTAGKTP